MNAMRRWIRHLWLDESDARRKIGAGGLERLETLVRASEARHRGELRLCVESALPLGELWRGTDSRDRAVELFSQLGVWDTVHNNGVLIYLLLADHKIEILADRGLAGSVPPDTWKHMVDRLGSSLHDGRFEEGLAQAIEQVSVLLREHYGDHVDAPNPNELPDAVVVM